MNRRDTLKGALALSSLTALPALAQNLDRPVRIIVPFAPGGTSDILARLLAPELTKSFGQNVVVENRTGASGNIGADLVARAFPAGLPLRWGAVMVLMANNMGDPARWGPTLVSLLREGEWRRAANQLKAYRMARNEQDVLVPVLGLRRRRWAEAAYALGMPAREAKARAWDEGFIDTVDDWPALPG